VLRVLCACLLVLFAACTASRAAQITAKTSTVSGEKVNLILVEDEFELGDEQKFAKAAEKLSEAIVLMASPGGNLNAGIEIGKAIRRKGYSTAVPKGFSCASACAIAWLGGRVRMMGEGSTVGFHAAYRETGRRTPVADSVGNALVGAYLNELGLSATAIAYITEPDPTDIRWLTFSDAAKIGITVERLAADDDDAMSGERPSRSTNTSSATSSDDDEPALPGAAIGGPASRGGVRSGDDGPGGPDEPSGKGEGAPASRSSDAADLVPSHDWAGDGEWIQLYSRSTGIDAIKLARTMRPDFPNLSVFAYDNGWYVVALGPYRPGAAAAMRDRLKADGRIPQDSLVNSGRRFAERIWPMK
jgi:hypothetical protein